VTLRIADERGGTSESAERSRRTAPDTAGAFRLVFRHKYLLATAVLILLLNWVNTNGENFLFGTLQDKLHAGIAANASAGDPAVEGFIRDETTRFYGDLFFWVNLSALLLQSFVASRLLQYGGFGATLLVLPVISLISYSTMALHPVLSVMKRMKIAENATGYSLNNTARQVLWLPTTRAMKYRAKAAIDTIFVRTGDVGAGLTAFVGTHLFHLRLQSLLAFNAGLAVAWLAVGSVVVREHHRLGRRDA
jgi:AAA family ATP:ADP antiporter